MNRIPQSEKPPAHIRAEFNLGVCGFRSADPADRFVMRPMKGVKMCAKCMELRAAKVALGTGRDRPPVVRQ